MKISAANGLARILKTEGVEWVSTFPVCCVNNALGEEDVRLIMMRDERYAVGVADAYSRLNAGKKIGVCTVMGGLNPAGLQMAYGALAQAYEDSSPVLCISGGVPAGSTGQRRYDIGQAFRSVTKWMGQIDQPERVPEFMRRAFTQLRTGRPGPVLVTVPRGLGEYEEDAYPYAPVKGWRVAPDPNDVRAAVKAVLGAKTPLLYAGEGVYYGNAAQSLRELAEAAQLPVLTTLKAKSVFPEDHPLSVGTRGETAVRFLQRADLILAIGTSLGGGHFRHKIPNASAKSIIHCTVDPFDVNNTYRADYAVIGDAGLILRTMLEELEREAGDVPENEALLAEIRASRQAMAEKYGPLMASDEKPINPYRVYGDMMKVLDPDSSFVTHDSGNTRDQSSTVYEARIPRGYMGWGNVSTLGYGLAAAMAAKLTFPGRQCVNITGDAGVAYMIGNMEALVRHEIGVTTVHINNGGFAGYGPGFWGPGHDPYTCEVCDHAVADMSKALEALGYYAEDVTEPADIIPALERALAENGKGRPAYLEVICSRYPVFGEWAQ